MIINEINLERVGYANDVYDDITRLNRDFINFVRNNKLKWILSRNVIQVPYLITRINSFELEGAKILALLGTATGFEEAHELFCDFNHLLEDFKSTFISYMDISRLNPAESSEDLFNIYTYGGKV